MAEQDEARRRLGRLVRDVRLKRDVSVRKAAQEAGIDRATWAGIEDGTRATRDTNIARVERWAQWEPGSISAILAGGDPMWISEPLSTDPADWFDDHVVDEAERRILTADHGELVALFRVVESSPGMTRSMADQWLVDALDMRERARQRREATKRDAS